MIRRELAWGLAAFLVLASVAGVLWVHRLHFDRPNQPPALFNSDMESYFYPVTVFMHREIRAGRWPLWNPYQMAGTPFLALHAPGALYPLNRLILRWIEPGRALEVHAVLHLVIAGFFTWLFAGSLGLSPPARIAAAFAFMLAPATWLDIYCTSFLSSSVWLPAVLWSVRGLVVDGRLPWAVALSASLSLAFLAGYSQGFLFQAQLAFVYGLFGLVLETRREMRGRVLACFGLAGALTLGLTAAQMLPSLELAHQGTRALSGLPVTQATFGLILPGHLIAGAFGRLSFILPETLRVSYPSIAVSSLTIPLILLGLADRRYVSQWAFFLTIWIISGLFMLGIQTPVYEAYYSLPLGNLFRGPVRISFVFAFSAAVLVGIGVQGAMRLARPGKRAGHAAALVAGLLVLGVAADLYHETRLSQVHPSLNPSGQGASRELVEGLKGRAPLGRVFVEFELFVPWGPLRDKMGTMNELYVVPDYEPILPADYKKYFEAGDDPPWHGSVSVLASISSAPLEELGRLMDLMSVEYYLSGASRPVWVRDGIERFVGNDSFQLGEAFVARRTSALPRSFIVDHLIYEPDQEKTLRLLRSGAFNPRDVAVVDSRLPGLDGGASRTDGNVVVTSYEPESVTLKASCRASCFLILTDLYYPGWVALVDGRKTEIHRTNFLFRGIRLEPGSHEVIFRYRPRSFFVGFFITIVTLAVAAGVLVVHIPWKRAGTSSATLRSLTGRN